MRPHRVRLTHSLVENYDLNKRLQVKRPTTKNKSEVTQFHADDYIDFLSRVTPDNQEEYQRQMRLFNLGPVGEADCPVFDGLFEYCLTYSNGSVGGASLINNQSADVVLNWAGGMHHAKKAEASGFCYVNDIVLSILELLKVHHRVLYVDIDIHHGDGVEEAFYLTDRVMTVSFHKYGDFFPGTGAVGDVGLGTGQHYSVNVPLQEGMDDDSYKFMFEPIMQKVMEVYQPGAIVVCGGADSLSGDRLGCFNLSLQGHSNCVEFLAKFNVPMLVLGGGGYTMRNVARCWCYETGRMLGMDLPDTLPTGALREFDYYADTRKLRITVSNMKNANSREQLEAIKTVVLQNLSRLNAAPGAAIAPVPAQYQQAEKPEEEMEVRGGGQAFADARTVKEHDYASDDDEKDAKRHQSSQASPRHGPADLKIKAVLKKEPAPASTARPSGNGVEATGRDERWLQQDQVNKRMPLDQTVWLIGSAPHLLGPACPSLPLLPIQARGTHHTPPFPHRQEITPRMRLANPTGSNPPIPGLGPSTSGGAGGYGPPSNNGPFNGPISQPNRQMSGGPVPIPGMGQPSPSGVHPLQQRMGPLGGSAPPRPMAGGALGNGPPFGFGPAGGGFPPHMRPGNPMEFMRGNPMGGPPQGSRGFPPQAQPRPAGMGQQLHQQPLQQQHPPRPPPNM
ncbi:hypothetical protein WJX84_005953 [Apatococcus fuscideae]|uniref:histone deacetylase n=1 Tax=Apatococcus fuscideae TaxID=2026836 RepID=A0AAW1SIK7_9CHLO